jgi:hypothetical protein
VLGYSLLVWAVKLPALSIFVISPGILELLIKVVNSAKIMEKSIIKDLSFE